MLEVEQRESTRPLDEAAHAGAPTPSAWVDALSLAEGGLLADVAVILELVRIYLPLVGEVFALLVPMPFVLLTLRRGLRATVLAVVVGTLLVSMITGPHFGWRMGVSGIVGLALGFAIRARLRPALVVVVGSVITSLALYAFFWATIWLTAVPLSSLVQGGVNLIHAANSTAAFVLRHLGLGGFWQRFSPLLFAIEGWMIAYWPLALYVIVLCGSIAAVVGYYLIANRLMRFFGYAVRPFPSPRVERLIGRLVRLVGRVFRLLWFWRRRPAETP